MSLLKAADKGTFLCPYFPLPVREKKRKLLVLKIYKSYTRFEIIYGERNFDKLENFDNSVILFMGAGNINKLCNSGTNSNKYCTDIK